MPRTISDEEYNALLGHKQVAEFIGSIYDDPRLNREAKALIKKKYPHLQIQGYDTEQHVEQLLVRERQAREAEKAAQQQAEQKKRFDEIRENTKKKYSMTDKGLEDLEKFMVEKNVGDYDVAAEHVISKTPKPIEASYHDHYWQHDKKPDFKEITADPEKWAHGEIMKSVYDLEAKSKNQRF